MEGYSCSVPELAAHVHSVVRRGGKCCLLIGAGCSVTGRIPTANEFADIVQNEFPIEYAEAQTLSNREKPTYFDCMQRLTPDNRWTLLGRYVQQSRVTWAHLCIATLLKEGLVDRVLTTNFDPLIERACSILLCQNIGVYDLTLAADNYRATTIVAPAVLYLHGRYHGFSQVMTFDRLKNRKHRNLIADVIRDTNANRVWIVCGYSGAHGDPVFSALIRESYFSHRLFWVGFKRNEPEEHLKKGLLLKRRKFAYFVHGQEDQSDADVFFSNLSRELGIYPLSFLENTDSYVAELVEHLPKPSPLTSF